MLTSSTIRVPLILIGESSQRAMVFTIEYIEGTSIVPIFTNTDIQLVYEHTTVESMAVQKPDEKNTLLIFTESEDIEKICSTL